MHFSGICSIFGTAQSLFFDHFQVKLGARILINCISEVDRHGMKVMKSMIGLTTTPIHRVVSIVILPLPEEVSYAVLTNAGNRNILIYYILYGKTFW